MNEDKGRPGLEAGKLDCVLCRVVFVFGILLGD